jgi:hypothetical protein
MHSQGPSQWRQHPAPSRQKSEETRAAVSCGVNRKLTEALKRLGEPVREYRRTRDRIVRKKYKKE